MPLSGTLGTALNSRTKASTDSDRLAIFFLEPLDQSAFGKFLIFPD